MLLAATSHLSYSAATDKPILILNELSNSFTADNKCLDHHQSLFGILVLTPDRFSCHQCPILPPDLVVK